MSFDCNDTPDLCTVIDSNNEFGFNLFSILHEADPHENLFFSPFSIATALTMAMNGAEGNTLTEMRNALELNSLSVNEVNDAYHTLLPTVQALDEEVIFKIANSLWVDDDFSIKPDFNNICQNDFDSDVITLDMTAENAPTEVNDWVSDNTNGLIEELIDH